MKRWLWLSSLALVWACAGTETGNPSFQGTLEYHAYSSTPTAVALSSAGGGQGKLVVSSTWLVLGEVDFVEHADCNPAQESKIHAEGLGAGDHARSAAVTTPVELDAGLYCGVRLPFLRAGATPSGAPAGLLDHSVMIEGVLPDARPFRVRSNMQADVFLQAAPSGFELTKSTPTVLIGFDVATWLGELDFSSASADASGTVVVESGANDALLQQFEARLARGIALYRDDSGAGTVTQDSPALAHGSN